MEIIEYQNKYLEDVRDLLVELEEYIVEIDDDHLDMLHKDYREKMALVDLDEVKNNQGKCYLAVDNNKAVGLIMGCIFPYAENDYLDYKCPRRGEITELIVSKKVRSNSSGKLLIKKIEDYFKSMACEYVILDVFFYNEKAKRFYENCGYHARMITNIKKL